MNFRIKTALMMLSALPLLAADGVQFRGRVTDAGRGQRLTDAIVTMSTANGPVTSVTTNDKGEFLFEALPAGSYKFRVTAHNFAIYEREMTLSENGGMSQLTVKLQVPSDRQTVSVAELTKPDSAVPAVKSSGASRRRGF